jgi:5,6-dimethylbenzimidazole synthase
MPLAVMPDFDDAFRAKLLDLFKWRRDVRSFQQQPLPDGLLDELLQIASLAPSVGLSQPWRFVKVDDPARRAAVKASFEACNAKALADQDKTRAGLYARLKLAGFDEAPCQIAVCVEAFPDQGHGLGRGTMPETTSYSAVMASHTLWLAARAFGLGVGWVSILDPEAVMASLDVPPSWRLIAYFCIGYPAAQSDIPELEHLGWERRRPVKTSSLKR